MRFDPRSFAPEDSRQEILQTSFLIEQICLVMVLQIALINLFSQLIRPLDLLLPPWLLHMRVSSAAAALAATLSLFCSESNRTRSARLWGKVFAASTAALAAVALFSFADHGIRWLQVASFKPTVAPGQTLPSSSFAFLLMGTVALFIRSKGRVLGMVTDGLASCLAFLVLLLVSEFGFGIAGVERSSAFGSAPLPSLACLAFLTVAIVICRAEYGTFSVFLGTGIGGRIARMLAPVLLIVPFLRELGRAHLLHAQLVPVSYSTALLASIATAVSFILLIVLTQVIDRMQRDIQDLTLRDELTGLYNFRGFNLFAEQAFRLARRARSPFGVLFIDMDNLKTINDDLGHNAGSTFIVEIAKLLNETFRETDVIGRLGGDEFVVAGQFEKDEIESMIGRLRSAAGERKNSLKGHSLNFSIGYAATEQTPGETLKSVVSRADGAMYREKRAKKRLVVA